VAFPEAHAKLAIQGAESRGERARVDEEAKQLHDEILASHPFPPAHIRLMYERWGSLPSCQRTRGAVQFLGTVVHVLFKCGHAGALIMPGDIPLDDPDVRAELSRQVGERAKWDSVLDGDVAGWFGRGDYLHERPRFRLGRDRFSELGTRFGKVTFCRPTARFVQGLGPPGPEPEPGSRARPRQRRGHAGRQGMMGLR
jgi:hypothetical protein